MEEIRQQEIEKGQIVLLGDCVIESLDKDVYFSDLKIYNNGISGDTTSQLFDTLYKRAIKYKPSKLFLSIGSNDFGFEGKDVKEIYENIIDICEEVKRRSSETEIYLVSIIPVNPAQIDYINRAYVDSRDNFEINMLNYYLKNYARKNRIKFVDATKELKNNFDMLNLKYTIDGFHLNENGLQVVSSMIRKYV
jgi:lysophospholipase L1-like esterase